MDEELRSDILSGKSIGKNVAQQFILERFKETTVPFWDPIKKLKLNKFSTENKPLNISWKYEATIMLKDCQSLFSIWITVSTSREVDLKVYPMN